MAIDCHWLSSIIIWLSFFDINQLLLIAIDCHQLSISSVDHAGYCYIYITSLIIWTSFLHFVKYFRILD